MQQSPVTDLYRQSHVSTCDNLTREVEAEQSFTHEFAIENTDICDSRMYRATPQVQFEESRPNCSIGDSESLEVSLAVMLSPERNNSNGRRDVVFVISALRRRCPRESMKLHSKGWSKRGSLMGERSRSARCVGVATDLIFKLISVHLTSNPPESHLDIDKSGADFTRRQGAKHNASIRLEVFS